MTGVSYRGAICIGSRNCA